MVILILKIRNKHEVPASVFIPTPENTTVTVIQSSVAQTPPVTPTFSPPPHSQLPEINSQIKILQEQIKEARVSSLDQQLKNIQNEIVLLKNQLQTFQNYEYYLERNATTQLQFQQTLNQQRQEAINNRIRGLSRDLLMLQAQLQEAQLNSDLNQPDKEEQIENRINNQEDQIKELISLSDQISSDALDETSALSKQFAYAKNNLSSNQAALQSQINFLLADLDRIQDEKNRSQELISYLTQRLQEKQLELKERK